MEQLASATVMRLRWRGDKDTDETVKRAYAKAANLRQHRPPPGQSLARLEAHRLVTTAVSIYKQRQAYERPRAPRYAEYVRHAKRIVSRGQALLKRKPLEQLVRECSTISSNTKRNVLWRLKVHQIHHPRTQKGLRAIGRLLQTQKEAFTPEEELAALLNGELKHKQSKIHEVLGTRAKKIEATTR
jgi:hypothetical protein